MAIPISSARESLSHALSNRFLPNLEYLLQGSILDSAVEHLMHRSVKKPHTIVVGSY